VWNKKGCPLEKTGFTSRDKEGSKGRALTRQPGVERGAMHTPGKEANEEGIRSAEQSHEKEALLRKHRKIKGGRRPPLERGGKTS